VIRFPLLLKPRWGTSSIGIETVENEHELRLAREWGRIQLGRTILTSMSQADPDNCFVIQERWGEMSTAGRGERPRRPTCLHPGQT